MYSSHFRIILATTIIMILGACSSGNNLDHNKEREMIESVLFQQQDDWNSGDIKAFMEGYVKSDDLTFISSSGIYKGWESTLQRYRNTYPTEDKMGNLTFDLLDVQVFSENDAHVFGKYTLKDDRDSIFSSGHYTLLWKKTNGKWQIIMDQTCG